LSSQIYWTFKRRFFNNSKKNKNTFKEYPIHFFWLFFGHGCIVWVFRVLDFREKGRKGERGKREEKRRGEKGRKEERGNGKKRKEGKWEEKGNGKKVNLNN
jgi:hypothetical protein